MGYQLQFCKSMHLHIKTARHDVEMAKIMVQFIFFCFQYTFILLVFLKTK